MLDVPQDYGDVSQNVITFDRNGHRYIFLFCDKDLNYLGPELGRMASDGSLDFSWRDARDVWEFAEDIVARFG